MAARILDRRDSASVQDICCGPLERTYEVMISDDLYHVVDEDAKSYTRTYIQTQVDTHIYIYIHTHIHTYIRTYIRSQQHKIQNDQSHTDTTQEWEVT